MRLGKLLLLFLVTLVSSQKCPKSDFRCGLRIASLNHAVEGKEAIYAPWAVSIGRKIGGKYIHLCSGSIISENIVITAAHCTTHTDFDRDLSIVRAGVTDLRFSGSTDLEISHSLEHPDYKENQNYYDVALIYLRSCLTFSSSIQPICLPSESLPTPASYDYRSVTTQGWGGNNDKAGGQYLTQIDVTVRPKDECNFKYESINQKTQRQQYFSIKFALPQLFNNTSLFCADHTINVGTGTCHGDSGGPSFKRLEQGTNILIFFILYF